MRLGIIRKNYESTKKGVSEIRWRLAVTRYRTLSIEELADCDLVIEAVFENMAVKKEIFTADSIAPPGLFLPPTHRRSTSTISPLLPVVLRMS